LILVAFIFGGHQLDRRLSAGGIFTLLGTFLGAGIAFYVLYHETRSASREDPGVPSVDDIDPGRGKRDPDRDLGRK
jgi:hypothetical protein